VILKMVLAFQGRKKLQKSACTAKSDSRGFFSPSLHNTLHAAPHRAFPEDVLKQAGQ